VKIIIIGGGVGSENLLFPTAPFKMKKEIRNVKLSQCFAWTAFFLILSASFTISKTVPQ